MQFSNGGLPRAQETVHNKSSSPPPRCLRLIYPWLQLAKAQTSPAQIHCLGVRLGHPLRQKPSACAHGTATCRRVGHVPFLCQPGLSDSKAGWKGSKSGRSHQILSVYDPYTPPSPISVTELRDTACVSRSRSEQFVSQRESTTKLHCLLSAGVSASVQELMPAKVRHLRARKQEDADSENLEQVARWADTSGEKPPQQVAFQCNENNKRAQ